MQALETRLPRLENGYARALDVGLRHKRLTLAVFIATAVAAVVALRTVPTGFFPQQDTGFLNGVVLTSQDASFAKTAAKIEQVGAHHARGPGRRRGRISLGSSAPTRPTSTPA